MAVPRLRSEKPFLELDPSRLRERFREASTIRGAFRLGRPVSPEEMEPIDLIVAGSVAVTREGAKVGKGEAIRTWNTLSAGRQISSMERHLLSPQCTDYRFHPISE